MTGSIDQISQRLAALDRQIETMGDTFTETYRGYLKQLGQTVKQQIILSCYQICTENYPKRFLALPMSQRQQLQENLQTLARQIETELNELIYPIDETKLEPEELPDELEALLSDAEADEPVEEPPLTPLEALTIWQEQLERSITKTLKSASNSANRFLQDAEILPKRIPQAVLDAAAKAEGGESNSSNLLNVLVSASEKSSDSDSPPPALSALMHIVAVNLKLSEIEFNHVTVMTWRGKLRELKQQFQTLAREYQKKRREQSVAEAQLAWKSTWVKDEP